MLLKTDKKMVLKNIRKMGLPIFLLFFSAFPFNIPEKPLARVNDYAKIFSSDFTFRLESLLHSFEIKSGNQIVVVTIPSLDGEEIESFAIKLAEKWKIGKKELDNGIIILVALQERKIRIEVGYGLEDKLTDAISSVIITKYIVPFFKNGDFEGGIESGIQKIIEILSPTDIESGGYVSSEKEAHLDSKFFIVIAIIFLFILIIDFIRYNSVRHRFTFLEWFILFSITFFLLRLFLSGGKGYGGGSGGFRSYGWGGFSSGGGRFGGGGASGRW
ncbi:MAG: TPM domain-containing protein [Chitinispirillaceae bacterium]|nr:TPM domain-containing protein [Chitinispirillaceae bacterium]